MFRTFWLHQLAQRWWLRKGNRRLRSYRHILHACLRLEALEDRLVLSTITDMGTPPGTFATGINDAGQVVGVPSGGGFLYSNGHLSYLGMSGENGAVKGINGAGQVAGNSFAADGGIHAFLVGNGQKTDLGTLPMYQAESVATGIDDAGQVVGFSEAFSGATHAFLDSNGHMTDLGTLPGDQDSAATGINEAGQVVGFSYPESSSGNLHAFLYSNGHMTSLGTPPGIPNVYATGLNDSGLVIVESGKTNANFYGLTTPGDAAFLYSKGQWTALGTLSGGLYTFASSINDSGQIVGTVGYSFTAPWDTRAFLYSNGSMIDLNTLLPQNSGWVLTKATAINNAGQIVGQGTVNGVQHAFLLSLNSLVPTKLEWDTTQGGIDFGYQVNGEAVPNDTKAALYWSTTDQWSGRIGSPVYKKDIPADTQTGTYGPFNVSANQLGTPPAEAKYLLEVTDPNNVLGNFDPSKNVTSLAVPDLVAESLDWHTTQVPVGSTFVPDQGGGVDFTYEITNADLPIPATISFYWVRGTEFHRNDVADYALAYQTQSPTAADSSKLLHVSAAQLNNIPPNGVNGTNEDLNLFAVVDAPTAGNLYGNVVESNTDNDVANLPADPDSIVSPVDSQSGGQVPSVEATPVGPDIVATFRPAGGALTLQQAATIFGVDHFNWIQKIIQIPADWTWYKYSGDPLNPASQRVVLSPPLIIDPVVSHPPYAYAFTNGSSDQLFIVKNAGSTDDLIFYWNEPSQVQQYTSQYTLAFGDAPEFSEDVIAPDQYVQFRTQLEGVTQNGGVRFIPSGLGASFTWDDNTVYGPGITNVAYTQNWPRDPNAPHVVSGGVFDVQYDNRPKKLAMTFTPTSIPPGTQELAYKQIITASGGSGALTVTYHVTSGSLPKGLSFTLSSNQLKISGTPTSRSSVTFSVTAKDQAGDAATQSYTLTVGAAPTPPTPSSPHTHKPSPPPSSPSSPPSLIEALVTVYLDSIELALDMLYSIDTTAVQASLAANLPFAGPFGSFVEMAGIERGEVLGTKLQGNNT